MIQQLLNADSRDSWQFVTRISVMLSWSKMAVLAETTQDTFHEPFSFSTHSNAVQVTRNEPVVIVFLIYFLQSWLFKTFMFPAFKNLSLLSASTSFVQKRKIPHRSSKGFQMLPRNKGCFKILIKNLHQTLPFFSLNLHLFELHFQL